MSAQFITYNFKLEDVKPLSGEKVIRNTIVDKRNGIRVTNIIPGLQCYINYLELLMYLRNKWISTGYLDLGMIPIIVGPSFLHENLVNAFLPTLKVSGLRIYAMPSTSFMLKDPMHGTTEYWAFRSDVADLLGCDILRVSTKSVFEKVLGVKFK